jgi:hypothetical protein
VGPEIIYILTLFITGSKAELNDGYTVKKAIVFPVPIRDVTNQTLSGREEFNNSRPGRFWVSDIPAGDEKKDSVWKKCLL